MFWCWGVEVGGVQVAWRLPNIGVRNFKWPLWRIVQSDRTDVAFRWQMLTACLLVPVTIHSRVLKPKKKQVRPGTKIQGEHLRCLILFTLADSTQPQMRKLYGEPSQIRFGGTYCLNLQPSRSKSKEADGPSTWLVWKKVEAGDKGRIITGILSIAPRWRVICSICGWCNSSGGYVCRCWKRNV